MHGGVARSRLCLYMRVESTGSPTRSGSAREIRDTPSDRGARCGTKHAARPPLLGPRGIIYHDRRGRAGGNFVPAQPLAAGESPRYSRPDIILLYLQSERGRVVYQQPSEPRFSPFIHLTPHFSPSFSVSLSLLLLLAGVRRPFRFSSTSSFLLPLRFYRRLVLPRRARE